MTDQGMEQVEVRVRRVEVTITLESMLGALAEHAGTLGAGDQGDQASLTPAATEHLQRLGQLAGEMRTVLQSLAAVDPALHARLQGTAPPAAPGDPRP